MLVTTSVQFSEHGNKRGGGGHLSRHSSSSRAREKMGRVERGGGLVTESVLFPGYDKKSGGRSPCHDVVQLFRIKG